MNSCPTVLKEKPMISIPMVTIVAKMTSSLGLTTFFSMIMEGRDSAVTAS